MPLSKGIEGKGWWRPACLAVRGSSVGVEPTTMLRTPATVALQSCSGKTWRRLLVSFYTFFYISCSVLYSSCGWTQAGKWQTYFVRAGGCRKMTPPLVWLPDRINLTLKCITLLLPKLELFVRNQGKTTLWWVWIQCIVLDSIDLLPWPRVTFLTKCVYVST